MDQREKEAVARRMVDDLLGGRLVESQPTPVGEVEPEVRRFMGKLIEASRRDAGATCMYGPCDAPAIESHAIQRAALERIAERGHVITFESRHQLGQLVSIHARPRGLRQATTFVGLCEKHDNEVFKSIEDTPLDPKNHSQPLLLGYRSVLAHAARQRGLMKNFGAIAKLIQEVTPGRPLVTAMDEMAVRGRVCFEIASMYQGLYERVLAGVIRADELRCLPVRLPRQAFASTCFFAPSYGFDGRPLNQPGVERPKASISLSVVPCPSGTYAVLVFAQADYDVLRGLVEPLMMMEDGELAARLFELALRHDDGVVVAPAAWSSLSTTDRDRLLEFKFRAIGGRVPFDCAVPQLP